MLGMINAIVEDKKLVLIGRHLDEEVLISIDAGTTSNRSILFDLNGKPIYSSQKNLHNTSREVVGLNTIPMRFGEQQLKHSEMLFKNKKLKVKF